jgi:IS4 transposase
MVKNLGVGFGWKRMARVLMPLGREQVSDLSDWGVGAMAANPDEAIPAGDETARLAVLDLDWDCIRAVDILVCLRSFLAKVREP